MHGSSGETVLQPLLFAAMPDGSPMHEICNACNGGERGATSVDGGDFCLKITRCGRGFFSTGTEQFWTSSVI
jgi:hypothetical protein